MASADTKPWMGRLVWAHLTGFPWWPGVIQEVNGKTMEVLFCGTGDLGTVERDMIVAYGSKPSWRQAKQKDRWKKKFRQAVEEADALQDAAGPDAAGPDEVGAEGALEGEGEGEGEGEDAESDDGRPAKRQKGNARTLPADKDLPGWKVVEHEACALATPHLRP